MFNVAGRTWQVEHRVDKIPKNIFPFRNFAPFGKISEREASGENLKFFCSPLFCLRVYFAEIVIEQMRQRQRFGEYGGLSHSLST